MPAPDPGTVWIEDSAGGTSAYYDQDLSGWLSTHDTGHSRNRARRAAAILRRYVRGTWVCRWCRDEISTDKRADARYCREGCRKAHARARKAQRRAWGLIE